MSWSRWGAPNRAPAMAWHELGLVQARSNTPENDQLIGRPFLLVTMKDLRRDLREPLNELAVKHRQDHVVFVYRDGGIELVAPYHNIVKATFLDLRAGIRAYIGTMIRDIALPVVEVRILS